MPTCSSSCACGRFWHKIRRPRASKWILTKGKGFKKVRLCRSIVKYFRTSRLSPSSCVSLGATEPEYQAFFFFFFRGILRLEATSVKFLFTKKPRLLELKNWHCTQVFGPIQGHPMDPFLKVSVLQANFCWLGDLERVICPGKESVAGK